MKFPFLIMLLTMIFLSCGEDNIVKQNNTEVPLYTHPNIELSGPGLQNFFDTIPLTFENTDSIYIEFWSETNIDTMDYLLLNIAVYDTISGSIYFSNFFTENPADLNRVHGFGFKMTNSTIKLENAVVKGSIDDDYLRVRNFNIYKK